MLPSIHTAPSHWQVLANIIFWLREYTHPYIFSPGAENLTDMDKFQDSLCDLGTDMATLESLDSQVAPPHPALQPLWLPSLPLHASSHPLPIAPDVSTHSASHLHLIHLAPRLAHRCHWVCTSRCSRG